MARPTLAVPMQSLPAAAGEPGARLAERLARAYLRTAHAAWERTGHMFEKFNALREWRSQSECWIVA